MDNWFETWFNSHYYHILYQNRDQEEAARFIRNLAKYLDLPSGAKALDLACGKGRHALQLRKLGFEVVGIDLAEESINEAKLQEQDGLEFFVHDMRTLYWTDHFDVVVNLFTSFGYFHNADDDQKTISSISEALKPGGVVVIDFLNAEKVIRNLVKEETKQIDGVLFEISRSVEDEIIKKRIKVVDGQFQGEFEEQVDALGLDDFSHYMSTAGLEVKEVFGDYELHHFNAETSDRLIIVAQKPLA